MRPLGLLGSALGGSPPFAGLGTGNPSSNAYLRGDGAWAAPPMGAWAYVAGVPASGTAVDFNGFSGGYDYMFVVDKVHAASSGYPICIRINTGSVLTSGYQWSFLFHQSDGSLSSSGGANAIYIPLGNNGPAGPSSTACAEVTVINPASATKSSILFRSSNGTASANEHLAGAASNASAAPVVGIRFLVMDGSSFGGGSFHCYRRAKS